MVSSQRTTLVISVFIIFSILHTPTISAQTPYIVYMGAHSHGREITKGDLDKVSKSHINFLAKYLGSNEKANEALCVSYRRHINGFAANLDEKVVDELKKDPEVISVFRSQHRKLQTTQSWEFLSLEKGNIIPSNSLWKKAKFGEDIIIGVMDSGIWPESKSFSDEGYGPVPSNWKGICQQGSDKNFTCNRKLIGARYYTKGFESLKKEETVGFNLSPRSDDSHGTHVSSTAGGNFVTGIEAPGIGRIGAAKGGAPRARLAMYKVCYTIGCSDIDSLKAFDHAIYEGVDVLSISIGPMAAVDYLYDVYAVGSMHAIEYNIITVVCAGNEGPAPSTVSNVAPWVLIVGASTVNRHFEAIVELGNGLRLKGESICEPLAEDKMYQLVTGEQAQKPNISSPPRGPAAKCLTELDPVKVKGKILVCERNVSLSFGVIGLLAERYGAVGLIAYNDEATGAYLSTSFNGFPSSLLTHKDGLALLDYIKSTSNPTGVIKPATLQLGVKPAPVSPIFSSRGPNPITPAILKPDVIAPGVDIVAANSLNDAVGDVPKDLDSRRLPYVAKSGTSMATPHVAGVVALVRAIYPNWSPAAIQSAIITTANPTDDTGGPILDHNLVDATPFAYGAGEIQPDRAVDPGLVYDVQPQDYLNFLCACGYNATIMRGFSVKEYKCPPPSDQISHVNLNYPSITVPGLNRTITAKRTVTNVGPAGTYKAQVIEPRGISVSVQPDTLEFKKGKDQNGFSLTLTVKGDVDAVPGNYVFGSLTWTDGVRKVRSPISVATK